MWPMRGKTGAVRLALAGDIPVIPVATWGVQQILPRYGKLRFFPPRRRVQVRFGAPVDLARFRQTTPASLVGATDAVMADIARLLGELRGEPAPEQRWDPSAHGQKETGRLEP
jgi:1-acyl-sn-glycerol-3-phosphate acyltransferase